MKLHGVTHSYPSGIGCTTLRGAVVTGASAHFYPKSEPEMVGPPTRFQKAIFDLGMYYADHRTK